MNNIYDAIINKSKPAMYLDKDNKCAGFDDFDIAVMSGRAFCCDMVQEVIPVDIDATELPYLQEFRTLIQQSGYAYIEVMSGGDMSDNRHFYIYIDQKYERDIFTDKLRSICGSKLVRVNQKIRPPYTPHRTGTAKATPICEQQVQTFIKATERLLV